MHTFFKLAFTAMTLWSPINNSKIESTDEARIRYLEIAEDAASVAFDKSESPVFIGDKARIKTYFLMLSIAGKESYYNKYVDLGFNNGDDGKSFCLMQINLGNYKTKEGWSGIDLVGDRIARQRCFKVGLRRIKQSFILCKHRTGAEKLGGYTHGYCPEVNYQARLRYNRAMSFVDSNVHFTDEYVMSMIDLPEEYWNN